MNLNKQNETNNLTSRNFKGSHESNLTVLVSKKNLIDNSKLESKEELDPSKLENEIDLSFSIKLNRREKDLNEKCTKAFKEKSNNLGHIPNCESNIKDSSIHSSKVGLNNRNSMSLKLAKMNLKKESLKSSSIIKNLAINRINSIVL